MLPHSLEKTLPSLPAKEISSEVGRLKGNEEECAYVYNTCTHEHIHMCMHSTHRHNTQTHTPHTQCLSDISSLRLSAKIP